MSRIMIEDYDADGVEGYRISLMQEAGMHEDTYTIKHSISVHGDFNIVGDLWRQAHEVWDTVSVAQG